MFLIVGNAIWHHAKIAREFIRKHNQRLRVEYFPAYSPEYNPSEQCWKALKRDLLTSRLFLSADGISD